MTACLARAEGRGSDLPRSLEAQLLHQDVQGGLAQGGERDEVFQPLRMGSCALVSEGDEFPVFLRGQAPGAALRHQRMVALPALRGPARIDLAEQCRLRRVIRWAEADGAHGVGQQVRSDIA